MARYLGVDLGSRRVGLAICDAEGKVAVPYTTLQRSSDELDAAAVAELAMAEGIKTIVLGMPLNMDGSKGDAAVVIDDFASRLRESGMRVRFVDERLTTVEAEKALKGRGMGSRKRREVVDQTAATIILQAFLDQQ